MKNIYKILTLSFVAIIATSCDRDTGDYPYLNDRVNTIGYTSSSSTLFVEDGAANNVSIGVAATTPVGGGTFSISVDESSTAVEGVDFTIEGGNEFSFESGNIVSTFSIVGLFEGAIVEGKTVVLNLASTDFAVSASNQYSLTLVQFCPFEGLETTSYTAYPTAFGADAPEFAVTLTPVGNSINEYTIASGWGPNFVGWATADAGYNGLYVYSGTIIINDDFTIDFDGDDAWATGGSGEFSPCTQEFSYTLTQGLFESPFTTDVVLIPN
jgi:hypothetical protein